MKLTLTALTVAAALTASGASAFDPDDLRKLIYTNECVKCDLSDLTDLTMWGTNLAGANLRGASLAEDNLSGANLSNADLSGANLYGLN